MARFRYMVDDAKSAASFYTEHLDFEIELAVPAIYIVTRGDITLLLSGPKSSARRPMPDGSEPVPGGWNRLLIDVDDLDTLVEKLKMGGVKFRNEIISGPGGRQIVAEDLDGNPIELFEAD
ncbi:MAG: VOC family protein [Chloroflexi bacterium]|nr:VOC family protein [Chloroflexota bacterium]MCH8114966.1 VOC family protein [Chloroflexota bacterium]MCI0775523.1 VOC family protein [Chloroflexota bacterium]MCI0804236.1 VOC family protein [Chloroflexota bacterium]MCI0809031.1 VOC family protein [Chloroflexota bacterium]